MRRFPVTEQNRSTMTEEEKGEAWLADAQKLRRSELLDVLDKWQRRAKKYGFAMRPPDLVNGRNEDLVAYAFQARKHWRDAYRGKLPEALSEFDTARGSLQKAKEILEHNGHHFGLFSDIEPLLDQLSQQLADITPKQP